MINKNENDKMDQELMDIVNSNSTGPKQEITIEQISIFLRGEEKKSTNLVLQEESLTGIISEKKTNLAKIMVIAGVSIAVFGSLVFAILNLPFNNSGSNSDDSDVDESSIEVVSDVSALESQDLSFSDQIIENSSKEIVSETSIDKKDNIEESKNIVSEDVSAVNSLDENSESIKKSEVSDESEVSENLEISDESEVSENMEINEESDLNDNSDISKEEESEESLKNFTTTADENIVFEVGTSSDIEDTRDFLNNSYEGYLINFYSKMYGLDSSLVTAVCFQESGGVNLVGGAANGLMMLENIADYDVTVYNYNDECYETITVSYDKADNEEYNIRCGIANLQNKINHYNGNIYAALQAYNYSEYTLDNAFVLNNVILNGINDFSWLYITEDVTNNPQKYGISQSDENGEEIYKKYGVSYYPCYTGYHLINRVIKYNYISDNTINEVELDFATAEVKDIKQIGYINEMRR